jgi:hypothetical protein
LIALSSAIARLCRRTQTAREREDLLVQSEGTARHIILREGDLDAFIESIARGILASANGIQLRQCRLTPQAPLSPERERLCHHDRMPAEDAWIAVVLIAVRDYRIIERIGAIGLGCGGRCIERCRAERRVESPTRGEYAFHSRAQGLELCSRGGFSRSGLLRFAYRLEKLVLGRCQSVAGCENNGEHASTREETRRHEITSNPGRPLADETACLHARWVCRTRRCNLRGAMAN